MIFLLSISVTAGEDNAFFQGWPSFGSKSDLKVQNSVFLSKDFYYFFAG